MKLLWRTVAVIAFAVFTYFLVTIHNPATCPRCTVRNLILR